MEMTRRSFLAASAAAVLPRAGSMPNIIYILADDLGWAELCCYGQKMIATPNVDRLAAEGIRFEEAYSGGAVCAPTRCTLMTGLHTGHARVRGNRRGFLLEQDRTVAQVLKGAGYRTAIFGKWGIGPAGTPGTPNKKGFDEWIGYLDQLHAHTYYPQHLWENESEVLVVENLGHQHKRYSHDIFTEASLRFIEQNKDRSFFLYCAFTLPHANGELYRETGNGFEVPDDAPYSARSWPQAEKNYASMVHRLDETVGKILAKVKETGIDEDTLILFSSDNGPAPGAGHDTAFFRSKGDLRGDKNSFYEGGIRVPLIARWPGKIRPGQISKHVTASWDFFPTAAEIAGLPAPRNLDGISFLPALLGKPPIARDYFYWENPGERDERAVRMGAWKGIRKGAAGAIELYNLDEDANETKDIAEQHPQVVAKIADIMRTARTEYHTPLTRNTLSL